MKRNSMTWKFVVPVVASILIILGLSGGFKYLRSARNMRAQLQSEAGALLEIGSLAMVDPIWNIRKEVIKDNAEFLLKNEEIGAVEVLDGDGKVLYGREKTEAAYQKENLLPPKKQDLMKDNQKIGTVAVRATGYFVKQKLLTEVLTTVVEIAIMALMLGAIVLFISLKLSKPIVHMASVLKDIAEGEGDLTKTIPVSSKDEIGQMATYFNSFIEKLNEIVLSIKGYSRNIALGSEELRGKMEEIGKTEETLMETSSSTSTAVEQMAGNIATIAQNTNHLSTNADETEKLAVDGQKAVQGTIDGINKVKSVLEEGAREVKSLGNRTSEIGNVATVINDIADQTNLLALNAAIESARAGEHGRGFAVVADEVRKLAERTAQSTKEITKMIGTIQKETNNVIRRMEEANSEVIEGVGLADSTGGILERIVVKVAELKQMVNMVANSTSEQSEATNEISEQTVKVAHSVEQTGKAVDQSTSSTREIAVVCEKLNEIVGMFKLREGSIAA
jgi:methyl-accepting chemotaxis protein